MPGVVGAVTAIVSRAPGSTCVSVLGCKGFGLPSCFLLNGSSGVASVVAMGMAELELPSYPSSVTALPAAAGVPHAFFPSISVRPRLKPPFRPTFAIVQICVSPGRMVSVGRNCPLT